MSAGSPPNPTPEKKKRGRPKGSGQGVHKVVCGLPKSTWRLFKEAAERQGLTEYALASQVLSDWFGLQNTLALLDPPETTPAEVSQSWELWPEATREICRCLAQTSGQGVELVKSTALHVSTTWPLSHVERLRVERWRRPKDETGEQG